MKKLFFLFFILILPFISCEKELSEITSLDKDQRYEMKNDDIVEVQKSFARIFVKAINENEELRELIKIEALKRFDNDYDVLFNSIKKLEINDITIVKLLQNYADSSQNVEFLINQLPLLTIFVPSLPKFNINTWDTESENVSLAINLNNNMGIYLVNKSGEETILPSNFIPGESVLVIKNNERVRVNRLRSSIDELSYSFIDSAFNPEITSDDLKTRSFYPGNVFETPYFSNADQILIDAYNQMGVNNWQRDFIYYGIDTVNTKGPFNRNYYEYITGFQLAHYNSLKKSADDIDDPILLEIKEYENGASSYWIPDWTDGYLEFKIELYINARNGAGTLLTKYFSVNPNHLVDVEYEYVGWEGNYQIYELEEVKFLIYNPNLELIQWDLENYSTAWKLRISEIDDDGNMITLTEQVTASFANNFSAEAGLDFKIFKIGGKYGSTSTTTNSSTYDRVIISSSDDLGEAIISFSDPIIVLKTTDNKYKFNTITTGHCNLILQPKQKY